MKINVKIAKKEEIEKKISTEFIKLDSFLKLCDAVESGGFAKQVIQSKYVRVNGEICTVRGKKLRPGDKVEFDRKIYIVK